MIDRTTQGLAADPEEVQAVLLNVCRFHLAERDPVLRYQALTQEQVLYDGLVAAIRRERGRALAELLAAGHKLADIAEATGLGTRQRVQRLIQAARDGDDTDEEQTGRIAAARDFDERMAAVEATLDEVVGPSTAEMFLPPFDLGDNIPEPRLDDTLDLSDDDLNPAVALEPTQIMPALGAVLQPTRELPQEEDEAPWWRRGRDNGAA